MKTRVRRRTARPRLPVRRGYKLSSEEQGPRELVRLADQAGFMRFYQREILPRVRAVLTG